MLAQAISCGISGAEGVMVSVEVFLSGGLVSFEIVGLPSAAVKECRDRVRAALTVSGFKMPVSRIVCNLAPADVRKEGTSYELAIAVALLCAKNTTLPKSLSDTLLLGELSLDGKLQSVRGVLPMVIAARKQGVTRVVLPNDNAKEIASMEDVEIYPASDLRAVYEHITGENPLPRQAHIPYEQMMESYVPSVDLREVKGQALARKALEVAAAGGHNMLMVGVPGSGKSMLAKCLQGILPPMTYEEALETTRIYSAAGELPRGSGLIVTRPFRSPHHSASMPALIGGGASAKPGEVSLAHNGVLYLDELPEFDRRTLEALRQPLEDGQIMITRAAVQARYPSGCMLVCSMNPCPCGHHGSLVKECRCTPAEIKRYLDRISGPLLDRIDLQIEMDAVSIGEIEQTQPQEDSQTVRMRVIAARERQRRRYEGAAIHNNSQLTQQGVSQYCVMDAAAKNLLTQAAERFHISMRTYSRLKKVALTIADLHKHDQITASDMALAIQLRNLSGQYWR